MSHEANQNRPTGILPPKPIIRTLIIQSKPNKWQGCIYLSAYDATGQLILFLKSLTTEYEGYFLNNPVLVLNAPNKSGVEEKLITKLQSITNINKTPNGK